jgi:hypothetical protein
LALIAAGTSFSTEALGPRAGVELVGGAEEELELLLPQPASTTTPIRASEATNELRM